MDVLEVRTCIVTNRTGFLVKGVGCKGDVKWAAGLEFFTRLKREFKSPWRTTVSCPLTSDFGRNCGVNWPANVSTTLAAPSGVEDCAVPNWASQFPRRKTVT